MYLSIYLSISLRVCSTNYGKCFPLSQEGCENTLCSKFTSLFCLETIFKYEYLTVARNNNLIFIHQMVVVYVSVHSESEIH